VGGLTAGTTTPVGPDLLWMSTTSGKLSVGDQVILKKSLEGGKRTGKVVVPAIPLVGTPAAIKRTWGVGVPRNLVLESAFNGRDVFTVIGFDKPKETKQDDGEKALDFDSVGVWVAVDQSAGAEKGDSKERKRTSKGLLERSSNAPDGICIRVKIVDLDAIQPVGQIDPASLKFIKENTYTNAFKNTRGEGLAGFIDNFQIDWQLNTLMWGDGVGLRAPQGCKITLGFTPIHDITPGIDADGMNRAPVYKVGSYSRSVHAAGQLKADSDPASPRAFDKPKE